MPLWKLTPLDLTDPCWEASTHRAVIIVRAPDEEAAREEAQKVFGAKTRFNPGHGIKAPPWKRPTLVKAERTEITRYDPQGPTEVLEPSL